MRRCACGCGAPLHGRPDKRYASEACSKRARRAGVSELPTPDVNTDGNGTTAAVRAELDRAGRTETYLGAAALGLARQIDNATAVMGYAALVKELRSTMEQALAGAAVAASPLDELRSRRDAKRGA